MEAVVRHKIFTIFALTLTYKTYYNLLSVVHNNCFDILQQYESLITDSYRRRSRQEYPHPDHSPGYQPDQVGPQNGPLSNRQPTLPRASYRNSAYEPDRPTMYYGNNDQQRY